MGLPHSSTLSYVSCLALLRPILCETRVKLPIRLHTLRPIRAVLDLLYDIA